MFARVAWGKVKPGTWQDYEQFYHDEVLPKTRDLRGLVFRELLQGADDPNEGISLSLWESREDLDAYERSDVYAGIVERGRAFYVGEFWVKHFDVRFGEARKQAQTAGAPQEGLGGWQSAAAAGSPEGREE
jgi:heme-degrading monooxygenase HmoA